MEENLEEVKGKKKFFKDKKNIAIIILSVLLLISLGSSVGTSSENQISVETSANLESNLTEKEEQIQKNQKKIGDLQKENKALIEEKKNLENENEQLQEEKQNLEEEKNQLQEEKQNLENEKSKLEEENKTLNTQIQDLNKTSSTKTSTSNTTTSAQNIKNSTTTQNTNSAIVYVTKTGKKYHKSNCSYLKNSKIEMSLTDAKSQGYTPCSRCY